MANSEFNLSNLNGSNGFFISGTDGFIRGAGAGDINGDGINDLVFGTPFGGPYGEDPGETYVVFGKSNGFSSAFSVSNLNGNNGFVFTGGSFSLGYSVSGAGDINGDGIDDLVVGAFFAGFEGQSYVVFGKSNGFSSALNISSLNGSNGFVLNGFYNDSAGYSVDRAGDINGDGIDDLVIGANEAAGVGTGRSYVVFGRTSGFSSTLNLSGLNGKNGFTLEGIAAYDKTGNSVSEAGDVNGDGIDDLMIGAPGADPNGNYSGQSYVVFGRSTGFSSTLNLSSLNGQNGFTINGIAFNDSLGKSVSGAGDINSDGIDDLVINAPKFDPNRNDSGQSYVVFGRSTGFSSTLNLSSLNGQNGFTINGIAFNDFTGPLVNGAGDINGDGIDDLVINAVNFVPNGDRSGRSYVVFGRSTGFSSSLNLSSLSSKDGFIINGAIATSGAGDINDDGIDDLVGGGYVFYGFIPGLTLKRPLADASGVTRGGITANVTTGILQVPNRALNVSFKKDVLIASYLNVTGTTFADTLIGSAGNNGLVGNAGNDLLSGLAGNDTLRGGFGRDTLLGGAGNDMINGDDDGDVLKGEQGNDLLDGGKGNDYLEGGTGNDVLLGGRGDDFLVGGADNDRLIGSLGSDQFYFRTSQPFAAVNFGVDQIKDFSRVADNTDKIVLSSKTFTAGTSFTSVSSDALAAVSVAFITFSTATGKLFYNQNGKVAGLGTGAQFATLSSINGSPISQTNTLLATDFSVIA
jgi:Ca2+-binding RTX toxin-like protein